MKLVFLYGAPGVGKLTVGRELSKLTGFPVFHNHLTVDLAAAVFPFDSKAFADLREDVWLTVFRRASQERLDGLIFTFVFEPTVLPGFYDRILSALGPHDEVLPVELVCEPAQHAERVAQPDRGHFLKTRNVDMVTESTRDGIYRATESVKGIVSIDTTNLAAEDTARLIAAQL